MTIVPKQETDYQYDKLRSIDVSETRKLKFFCTPIHLAITVRNFVQSLKHGKLAKVY